MSLLCHRLPRTRALSESCRAFFRVRLRKIVPIRPIEAGRAACVFLSGTYPQHPFHFPVSENKLA